MMTPSRSGTRASCARVERRRETRRSSAELMDFMPSPDPSCPSCPFLLDDHLVPLFHWRRTLKGPVTISSPTWGRSCPAISLSASPSRPSRTRASGSDEVDALFGLRPTALPQPRLPVLLGDVPDDESLDRDRGRPFLASRQDVRGDRKPGRIVFRRVGHASFTLKLIVRSCVSERRSGRSSRWERSDFRDHPSNVRLDRRRCSVGLLPHLHVRHGPRRPSSPPRPRTCPRS